MFLLTCLTRSGKFPALRLLIASIVLGNGATAAAQSVEIDHVISYGQSLSVGALAKPVLSLVQPYNSLMFAGGVITPVDPDARPAFYSGFTPLVERENGYWLGETPVAGMLEAITGLKFFENRIRFENSGVQYLGSASGNGGYSLAKLLPWGSPFFRLTESIYYGNMRAVELGRPYRLKAVTWAQGDSDYVEGTSRYSYILGMYQLRNSIDVVASNLTGNAHTVPFIASQVASHLTLYKPYPWIALAQIDATALIPNYYLAAPTYMLDYQPDGFHLTGPSSKWLGAYFGIAYKRVVIDGKHWLPLKPLAAAALGEVVNVRFHVPVPPLVLDTQQVSNPGQYGFRLYDPAGTEIPLTAVEVSAADTVRLVANQLVPAGSVVRYAFSGTAAATGRLAGARGNLRDSQGDTLIFDPTGINRPMHNWCVISEIVVTQ